MLIRDEFIDNAISQSTSFATMDLIRTFPSEILAKIFGTPPLNAADVSAVSHVSRWWRVAAVGASELWVDVHIEDNDVNHTEVVMEYLRRSQARAISLKIRLSSRPSPVTLPQLCTFLEATVKPNLRRCRSLKVQATRQSWIAISAVFREETYPLLRLLDVMAVHFFAKSSQRPGASTEELTFALPPYHPLQELSLHTMSVGNVPLPALHALRLSGRLHNIVGADGRFNRWLLEGPRKLELCRLAVPAMQFHGQDEESTNMSSVLHLKLAWIYASMDGHGAQNDCVPFFDALQMPLLRTLELESFHGRAWEDFLFALNTPKLKYPRLTTLHLKAFDFQGLSYPGVSFFLSCFPELGSVILTGCPLSTWEAVLDVLMLHPDLCPCLDAVEINGVLLYREEPLPFACACLQGKPARTPPMSEDED
ncbi:hypothetical protein B0H15DRAFT_619201 [Mycena belliarum]|uniref:F-box domain-containing protein n=1 Tax=Mycena belliarum TaxID=1033014 RepID=A0AAD6UC51_9AGAR|nr:hypothetical protein B0H15DRAFT_619201 [Mycena belliae]